MEGVMTVDNDSRGLYALACEKLALSQKVIPDAGLPLLDTSTAEAIGTI
jgi:hypothetical protein